MKVIWDPTYCCIFPKENLRRKPVSYWSRGFGGGGSTIIPRCKTTDIGLPKRDVFLCIYQIAGHVSVNADIVVVVGGGGVRFGVIVEIMLVR